MRSLYLRAIALLDDNHQDPCLRDACAALLATALEGGLELPIEAAPALWRWLVGPGSGRSWLLPSSLGNTKDERITREAIDVLVTGSSSQEVRVVAVDVLCGPMHARHVGDDVLLALAERHPDDADRTARLVRARHESLAVPRPVLLAIRERWSKSDWPSTRTASVDVARLVDGFDEPWWRRMVHDPAADVRVDAATALAKLDPPDRVLLLVRERLLVETHVEAKAEQLLALGKLVRRISRN